MKHLLTFVCATVLVWSMHTHAVKETPAHVDKKPIALKQPSKKVPKAPKAPKKAAPKKYTDTSHKDIKPMSAEDVKEFAKYHDKDISHEEAKNISHITEQMRSKQLEMKHAKAAEQNAKSTTEKSEIRKSYETAKKKLDEYTDMAKQEIENIGKDIKNLWEEFKSKL